MTFQVGKTVDVDTDLAIDGQWANRESTIEGVVEARVPTKAGKFGAGAFYVFRLTAPTKVTKREGEGAQAKNSEPFDGAEGMRILVGESAFLKRNLAKLVGYWVKLAYTETIKTASGPMRKYKISRSVIRMVAPEDAPSTDAGGDEIPF